MPSCSSTPRGRALATSVDEDDEASLERFRQAVGPIDEYREAHPSSRVEADEDFEEDEIDPDDDSEPEDPALPEPG